MTSRLALGLFLAAGISTSAHAGFISGNQTLSNGNSVALQGLEWMPLTYTAGLSRTDIEDGFTDRFGTTWGAGEWTYATRAQAETLLGSLWDKTIVGWSYGNAAGAKWFLDSFGGLAFDTGYGNSRVDGKSPSPRYTAYDHASFYFGADKECTFASFHSCFGRVEYWDNNTEDSPGYNVVTRIASDTYIKNTGAAGYFDEYNGLRAGYDNYNNAQAFSASSQYIGSMLVRQTPQTTPAPVSAPTSLSVLALGLLGLLSLRRRPKHQ
jgi:hypothetical protein